MGECLTRTFHTQVAADATPAAKSRPNVLFIAIGDLLDWVGYLGYQLAMNYVANTVLANVDSASLRFSG